MNKSVIEHQHILLASKDNTGREIAAQPALWEAIWRNGLDDKSIQDFLAPVLKKKNLQVVLTGAGSSAFIGNSVEAFFAKSFNNFTKAISTTSLVTHFRDYIFTDRPVLLISFARSGNSPESSAVLDLAEKLCTDVHHIAITCNQDGRLAKKTSALDNAISIVLPKTAEDKALAMTGSFTGMTMTALLAADIFNKTISANDINLLLNAGNNILNEDLITLHKLANKDFERIIFLGSGPLLGVAEESHLKVQELSDGRVIGKFDSFLGFRHGPKAILNNKTLVVFLFSANEYSFKYEKDLAEQITTDSVVLSTVGIFPNTRFHNQIKLDNEIILKRSQDHSTCITDIIPYVLPAQILGYFKSINLGLNPDIPSENGAISRVVKGVKVYDFK